MAPNQAATDLAAAYLQKGIDGLNIVMKTVSKRYEQEIDSWDSVIGSLVDYGQHRNLDIYPACLQTDEFQINYSLHFEEEESFFIPR